MCTFADDIFDALEALCYPGTIHDASDLENIELTALSSLISWLSKELQVLLKLDCPVVQPVATSEELSSFQIELNQLLRELSAPHNGNDLQTDPKLKLRILDYLCGETLSARILYVKEPDLCTNGGKEKVIEVSESETAKHLRILCTSLAIGKPPPNVSPEQLFSKVKEKLTARLSSTTNNTSSLGMEEPLLKGLTLDMGQWKKLEGYERKMSEDYTIRRQTLLTRLDSTVGSFKWKNCSNGTAPPAPAPGPTAPDNVEAAADDIDLVYNPIRKMLAPSSNVTLAHALAARESDCDTLLNSKVSSNHQVCQIVAPDARKANVGKQQRLSLHKYLIGQVPDRGGRPQESKVPVKETFDQQQRNRDNPRGRGGGRGGGGGGGGRGTYHNSNLDYQKEARVQGSGWNNSQGGDWSEGGGGRGGYRGHQSHHQQQNYGYNDGGRFQPYHSHSNNSSTHSSNSGGGGGHHGGGGYQQEYGSGGGGGAGSYNSHQSGGGYYQGGGGGGYQKSHGGEGGRGGYDSHHGTGGGGGSGGYRENNYQNQTYGQRTFRGRGRGRGAY